MSPKTQPKKQLKRGQDGLMGDRGFLSIAAVAKQCGVTVMTVRLWVKNGHVDETRVGMRVYIQRKSLEAFLGPEGQKMLEPAT
jgi:excisionase family DNA binding protein